MGAALIIAFLTTADPLYLPSFFETVLSEYGDRTAGVFVVPPLYAGQTMAGALLRYLKTFGPLATMQLGVRVIAARMRRRSIAAVCKHHEVRCESTPDVNDPAFLDRLQRVPTDLIVSVSCPQIFRKPLLDLPPLGCLNVHGSVLPDYRGVMPSFWLLVNDEERAGVSIFFMNEQVDAGDLCGQRMFEIRRGETLDQLLRRSKAIAADLMLDVLRNIENGAISRTPLDLSGGSYYSWPDGEAVRHFRSAGRKLW